MCRRHSRREIAGPGAGGLAISGCLQDNKVHVVLELLQVLPMTVTVTFKPALIGVCAALLLGLITADTAQARECTRLAFSVNDYGIEVPKRDSQRLLDDYIKKWTAEQGIERYTVGKKEVSCELFLDFGFFDEHTCRAEAPVCW